MLITSDHFKKIYKENQVEVTCLVLIILPDGFLICLQRFILSLSDSEGSTSSYSHQHYSLFLLIMFTESHWGFNFHFLDEQ